MGIQSYLAETFKTAHVWGCGEWGLAVLWLSKQGCVVQPQGHVIVKVACNRRLSSTSTIEQPGKGGERRTLGFRNWNSLNAHTESHSTTGEGRRCLSRCCIYRWNMSYLPTRTMRFKKKQCTRVHFPLTSGVWCFSQMKSRQFNYVRIKRSWFVWETHLKTLWWTLMGNTLV